jgi:hypothetical protein
MSARPFRRASGSPNLPRVLAVAATAILLSLAGPPPATPSPEAQRLFAEGLAAFNAGDGRAAERAWKQGYAVAHDPAFLVRIGEAEERAGAPAEAAGSYEQYLRAAPDAADSADIEGRLARLVRLAPPGAASASSPTSALPAPVGPIGPATRSSPPTGPPATAPPAIAPVASDAEAGHAAADEDSGWNRYNVTAWVATAATVALLGTAAFFGAQASSKASDADRLLTFRDEAGAPLAYTPDVARQYEGALTDGRRDAHDARVALVGAAGTAVVAATFFVIDGVRPAAGAFALSPTTSTGARATGASAAWTWTF